MFVPVRCGVQFANRFGITCILEKIARQELIIDTAHAGARSADGGPVL